jgi:hypothetical protein
VNSPRTPLLLINLCRSLTPLHVDGTCRRVGTQCKGCKEKIMKDVLRVGKTTTLGDDKTTTAW